jgi:transcription elongation factor Elf1
MMRRRPPQHPCQARRRNDVLDLLKSLVCTHSEVLFLKRANGKGGVMVCANCGKEV